MAFCVWCISFYSVLLIALCSAVCITFYPNLWLIDLIAKLQWYHCFLLIHTPSMYVLECMVVLKQVHIVIRRFGLESTVCTLP